MPSGAVHTIFARSKATKQSISPRKRMDCFVAALLAMTAATFRDSRFNLQRADRVCIRILAARHARALQDDAPKITEGAGNAGCATHPRPVCIGRKHTVVTTGRPQSTGIPCAMVLRLISRSPRGPGSFAPVIPEKLASQELSASVGAPGPHDFAVRLSYARLASLRRPPHPAPNVRDDAYAPLFGAGRLRTYN
jgi:hypothetical protein